MAVKVIQPDDVGDPEMRQRFLRHARAAAAIDHPNVACIVPARRPVRPTLRT